MTTQMKTFADQLRAQIKKPESLTKQDENTKSPSLKNNKAKKSSDQEHALKFFKEIGTFTVETSQKSMIRIDDKTMNLLKHIKLAKGIDINKFIVFCLHKYIAQHPWLIPHIQETLKNTEL